MKQYALVGLEIRNENLQKKPILKLTTVIEDNKTIQLWQGL